MMLDFPATSLNREPIANVLESFWDAKEPLSVLEVASGSGQHAAFFASRFPRWTFQPTDVDPENLASIEAYRQESGCTNLLAPKPLDVSRAPWTLDATFGAIFSINLIHISPWDCAIGLFSQARTRLEPGGRLYLYGAYKRGGQHTSASNAAFDDGLRRSDSRWGVRCLDEVEALALDHGLALERVVEMPSNNLSVLFKSL